MKTFIFVILLCLTFSFSNALSEAQMKAALKMIRNVCQPKFKVIDAQIDAMHKGDWNQDRNGQCYTWCILNMYKVMTKDNHFNWEAAVKAMQDTAPDSFKKTAIPTIKNCKNAVKTFTDKCSAGFEVAKCFYDDNPSAYFLP